MKLVSPKQFEDLVKNMPPELAGYIYGLETQLAEAREVIEFIAGRQSYPSLDETIKARAYLEKWNTPSDRE